MEKVELLAFYFSENKDQPEFSVADMIPILVGLGFARPNVSRLEKNIKRSRSFINGSKKGLFRLSATNAKSLRDTYPDLSESEEVMSDDSLLPEVLLHEANRAYLVKLAKQINASYENNLFDACALMMRRLLEVLLIHCFEAAGIEGQIKGADGNYQSLKALITKATNAKEISLSSSAKKDIDTFRELGNLSAHRVKYNCRRDDIRKSRLEYRAVVEELLYAAGLVGASRS